MIHAAWAIVISRYTERHDVSFGITVLGRNLPLLGIEEVTGPIFATVPFFVRLDGSELVSSLLERLQTEAIERSKFVHTGLNKIKTLNGVSRTVCEFESLIVVQPTKHGDKDKSTLGLREVTQCHPWFDTYPPNIECQLTQTGVIMKIRFDSSVVESFQIECMVFQFAHVLQQLCSKNVRIMDVEIISPSDLTLISQWNKQEPDYIDACVHQPFLEQCRRRPTAQAVCAWDGSFSFLDIEQLSRKLASYLRATGVRSGIVIPLCFNKSKWTVVSILGVLRAGGGCVFLDPVNHPQARMAAIIDHVDAPFAICAPHLASKLQDIVLLTILVKQSLFKQIATTDGDELEDAKPYDTAFVMFTSGSTGKPKGIVHDHRAMCSSFLAFGPSL